MGVQDLSKEYRSLKEHISNIYELKDNIIGIKISIHLYKALFSSPEISLLFHQRPSVSLGHLMDIYYFYAVF